MSTPKLSIRIDKLVAADSKVRAYATAIIDDAYAVHGIAVIEGNEGNFVRMPQSKIKSSDGKHKYQDRVHPITAEARAELNDAVLKAYDAAISQDVEAVFFQGHTM